jgi:hypothetical protein
MLRHKNDSLPSFAVKRKSPIDGYLNTKRLMYEYAESKKEEHTFNESRFCPHCGDANIERGQVDMNNTSIYQNIYCNHCGSNWTNASRLLTDENLDIEGQMYA